jgi:predicted membrane protein
MFLAIVFIIIGIFLLLNAMGVTLAANFWGFVLAILFLAMGVRLLMKNKGGCPVCGWHHWENKVHNKMHEHHEVRDEE